MQAANELIASLESLLNSSSQVGDADFAFGRLVGLRISALQFRNAVGSESTHLVGELSAQRVPDSKVLNIAARLRGDSQRTWTRIENDARYLDDPVFNAAMERVRTTFFQEFRPFQDAIVEAAQKGRLPDLSIERYTQQAVPALDAIIEMLDRIDVSARQYASRQLRNAQLLLAASCTALITLIMLLFSARRTLAREFNRPLQAILARIDALCGSNSKHPTTQPSDLGTITQALDLLEESLKTINDARSVAEASRNAFAKSEQRLHAVLDNFPFLVWLKDSEGRFLTVNRPFAESAMQPSPEALIGKTDHDVWPAELAQKYQADDREVLCSGKSKSVEEFVPCGDQQIWSETFKSPIMVDGQVIGTVGFARDITERKRSDAELEQHRHHLEQLVEERTAALIATEARACHLLESSADGLYGVSCDGTISFINPAACQMLGYHPDEVIGRSPHALFHHSRPDGSPFPIDECSGHNAVLRGQETRIDDEVYWHADGHPVPVMYAVHPIFQNGKNSGAVISFVDMSEQRAAAHARERALIAAENLARVRSEFLANMSHEIRTPLNGVLGFALIGRRSYQDCDKARNAFDKILSSGNLLLNVINEILDFSKIEAGKIHIEPTSVSLIDAMQETLELVEEQARSKGVQLSYECASEMPKNCFTDGQRLRQVLINLLSNAVKFTEHGSVTLFSALQGNEMVFRVTDTGIGMNADQIALLFNPFQQADGSTTRRFGGTGLGLAISKRILGLMGGSICVDSQPGIGSCFEFRLPYLPAPESIVPSLTEQGSETLLPERPLAGISILVAEDDVINQMVIEENLLEDGATIEIVGNGNDAVKSVSRNGCRAYDVVLMDIQMPEMDGYEATRRIHELAPDLPIIGQTAHASMEERQKCLAAGMVAHIAKPINVQALVSLIRHHVANKRASGNHLS